MKNFDNDFTLPPFPAFPCVSRYVPIGSVEESLERITRSVRAHESLISVIGPPGTGKSLLCGVIAQRFADTHDIVVLGETPILDEKTLRRQMINRLGIAMENHPDDDFQSIMEQRINGPAGKPCGMLLVIDEAQTLSEDLLESVRMLTNIMREGQPRVTAIVVGGVKLEETLSAPAMNGFAQRISTRCYLHPMNAGETRTYIRHAIDQCGADPDSTIRDEAAAAIHHAASGVPRLINQMMTEAIDYAAEAHQQLIDENVVDRAWAQLQQLPSPMVEEPAFAGESSTIEFGTLDDPSFDEPSETLPAQGMQQHHRDADVETETADAIMDLPEEMAGASAEGEPDESLHMESLHSESLHSDAQPWEERINAKCDAVESELATATPVDFETPRFDSKVAPLPAELFADVELDESTQAIRRDVRESLNDSQLFGEFEDEEQLEVGRPTSQPMGPTNETASSPAEGFSMESMLHSEIVSLSHFAADTIQIQAEAELAGEVDESENEIIESEPAAAPSPMVVWYDEPEEDEQPRYEDDRDIVMISEEVDLEAPLHESKRIDMGSQRVKVDYQEILFKMRNAKA